MVQQRSGCRGDLRLSGGDADDHVLRPMEVRINRLSSFILNVYIFLAWRRSLIKHFYFLFIFLFFPPFFSNSYIFSNGNRIIEVSAEEQEFIKSWCSFFVNPDSHEITAHSLIHSFNFANVIPRPHHMIIRIRSSSCNYKRSTMQSYSITWHVVGALFAISPLDERSVYRLLSWYSDWPYIIIANGTGKQLYVRWTFGSRCLSDLRFPLRGAFSPSFSSILAVFLLLYRRLTSYRTR